jgi:segregation and condensation protein B
MSEDRFQLLRLIEALLFASAEPVPEAALAARLPEGTAVRPLIEELAALYANRGINLVRRDDRWAFRTAPDIVPRLQVEKQVPRRLSRAAVETLAIIAYHQPVTRAEIEEIRGVALSRGTLDTLLEANWVKPKGRRRTPGRPITWVTTDAFLDHFGLESCEALPGIDDLKAAGLLETGSALSRIGSQALAARPRPDGEDEDTEPAGGALDEEALVRDAGELPESD